MSDLKFDVRGIGIAVSSADSDIADAVERRLARHRRPGTGEAAITFVFVRAVPETTDAQGRVVYDSTLGPVRYDDETDRLRIAGDGFDFTCSCAEGRARAVIAPGLSRADWLASRPFLTLGLLETLKRRGLFGVHAAAVERDGRVVVIAGASGAGKSTLALSLALRGFSFMGDDLTILDTRNGRLLVGALCEELDLTPWTATSVLGLSDGAPTAPDDWPKLRIPPWSAFGEALGDEGRPGLVVFPRMSPGDAASRAIPVASGEALLRLAPDILLTDRDAVAAHLAAIGELVEASECFDLRVGSDPDSAAELVLSLL